MDIEAFITRWTAREGGAERANYQMFLSELCDVLGVERPEPAGAERALNDYVFERAVRTRASNDIASSKRIDLYRKGSFILEAKQSRLPGARNELPGQTSLFGDEPETLGKRSVARGWDVMMQNARRQAEQYVFLLDADHPAPPFIITCDVGHAFEIFADFTGTGRAYSQFPDRKGFRIYLEDLRKPEIRDRLATIWNDPLSLDPARESARVTREIARRLAAVSKALEAKHPAEDVAHFLMRCIFTMFAEDVRLLPENSFTELLSDCLESPAAFTPLLESLWSKMDEPVYDKRFFSAFKQHLRHFNGNLFKDARAFPLGREEIGELYQAAKAKWTEVDPAIFGTLLEQALEPGERRKLGAHYTPRSYVQRLVEVTVMEPLRADWDKALTRAEDAKDSGNEEQAIKLVAAFHHQLCTTRVLDPACGTGNFLYVSLELMKKLEGEVLEVLARLGATESLGLERETVDPHQFLGLELNPRAAAIAELVVWIGYLQQWYKVRDGHPAEPILRAFNNINFGHREGYDAVLTWDGYPVPAVVEQDGKRVETYPNARRPDWPEAEFIVGNPPFLGNKRMREHLGHDYVQVLRRTYKSVPDSVDLVMYWWDRAANLITEGQIRRFGLVTTNSLTQNYNRRVIQSHFDSRPRVSLIFALADHPWTKIDHSSAAVRIAMTVAEKGEARGELQTVVGESDLDTDTPAILLKSETGMIASDLSLGAATTMSKQLLQNADLSHQGVTPLGEGFRLSPSALKMYGYSPKELPSVIKRYLIGRDLVRSIEEKYIIDFYGINEKEARNLYPILFQIILEKVKPERDLKNRESYREKYWIFAEPRSKMREALEGQQRYIVTCRTAKFRLFNFVDSSYLSDAKIVAIALPFADALSVLSSRIHNVWAMRTGAWLGVGNDSNYNHSECFAKFPFPDPSEDLRQRLREAGEELDATRKRVLAEHPDLTLTGLYNVLEKLKSGEALSEKDEDVKDRGLVLILKELHETIDQLTAEAYGWPADLSNEEILEKLVALNAERAKEEAAGHVRWLRPEYQIPRFAKGTAAKSGELDLGETVVAIDAGKPVFPKDRYEQPLAVEAILAASPEPLDAATLSRAFKGGGKRIEPRVTQVLVTLARYGRATALPGGKYAARRAA
ncbi:class I SAM-dependent DNA methyltransferase [Hoeflea sp.]|uniref:class I SAM-dependent DNA methyltransferase n=1 Tax=Hoeflea sp. TaxID=1940281 RepID=UPI003B52F071